MVYSSSCIYAWRIYQDSMYFLKRQFVFLLISLILFLLTLLINIDILRKYIKELLIFNIFLLIVVILVGKEIGGAKRWIYLGSINFQPSELLKIFFLVYCADYFVRKKQLIKYFREGILPIIIVTGFNFLLLLLEPDMGTVIFWSGWLILMFLIVGVKKKHIFSLIICGLISLIILISIYPYRLARIVSYFDPWLDPQGKGFQLVQSQIAFGEGGFWGV
ncbi:MAG: FtsW/RodA/SpoVE family cell cycle protein, partial [Candidatus Omnitrophica bacterium]|nr:FtsW/RodA/SpoVE family cell cycle protein [Candidatus Omnitrophota bacterium]